MAEKRKALPAFNTPTCTFKYPHLSEIDYGTADYPKPEGVYNVACVLKADDPETIAFLAKLAPHHDEAISLGEESFSALPVASRKKLGKITVNPIFNTLYDKETEEETGEIEFRIKMNASGTRKDGKQWSQSPDLFDGFMRPIPAGVSIYGGTVGKVAFAVSPYFITGTGMVGLSLKLKAAQIIELVSSASKTASAYGFGEEGGFNADDLPDQPDTPTPEDAAPAEAEGSSDGDF